MAGTTQTIQQGPIASRQRQLQARYNLTRHEALKDTFVKQIISDPALLDQVASVQGGFIPRPAGMSTEAAAGKLTGIGLRHVAGTEIVGPLVSKGVQAVSPSLASSLGMGTTVAATTTPAAAATGSLNAGIAAAYGVQSGGAAATGALNAGIANAYGLQSGAATALGSGFGAGAGSATGALNAGIANAWGLGEGAAAALGPGFGGGGGAAGGGALGGGGGAAMGTMGSLAIGAAIMAAFMTVVNWGANKFSPMKQRHIEAAAPGSAIRGSIASFLTGYGLDSAWLPSKGKQSSLQGTTHFKRGGDISKIVRTVKKKYPGYSQWEYAEMLKMNNLRRFFPMISVGDAKESRRQELLNPKTDPQYTLPEQMKKLHGKHAQNAIWKNQQLLGRTRLHKEYYGQENFNYNPKELRAGKGSNPETRWRGRRTDMTMDLFFKNLNKAIDNNTFLPAAGATQEQPPAQEQPTREQSLAKNAFKGIGIGSAIVRNVFNPKRLSRPDLGFGFQKLFSRQY